MTQKVLGARIANEILMHFRSQRKSAQDVSLSDYIETGSDGAALSLMDVVCEDCDLLEQISGKETVVQLRRAVQSSLTEQERQVIVLRYGLDGGQPHSLAETAALLDISKERVRQIEQEAMAKMKKLGVDFGLEDFLE